MNPTQPSQLLAALFRHVDEGQRVSVLDVGQAMPETVDFLSAFRCKLFIADLFADLPVGTGSEDDPPLAARFAELLPFPEDSRFDIVLFWDLFNYLEPDAIAAFLHHVRPFLHPGTVAHGFAVHNPRSPQVEDCHGIARIDALTVRRRGRLPPGYSPHSQRQLQSLLQGFTVERSVLLPDSRLELLLRVKV